MYQTIGEAISVIGIYTQGHFQPKKFQWQHRTFLISQITSVHNFKDGTVQKRHFAVLADHTLYLIEFNRTLETWQLLQVWVEA